MIARRRGQTKIERLLPAFHQNRLPVASLEETARILSKPIKTFMSWIAKRNAGKLSAAVSSGFDSRLLLALMLDTGEKPALETYTDAEPWEAEFVQRIAVGEALELSILGGEKRSRGHHAIVPFTDPKIFERNMVAEDGWSPWGFFNDGTAYFDRLERASSGTVLHGGAGEVYRNYFYLPNRPYTANDLTYFYDEGAKPAWMTAYDNWPSFMADIARSISLSIGTHPDRPLTREQVDQTYLYHRGQYFFGHQVHLNQRVGDMVFFFIDAANSWLAHQASTHLKSFGQLQGRMIAQIHERVAAYPSTYGFDFRSGPTLGYKVKTIESYLRPIWMRRMLAHVRGRKKPRTTDPAATIAKYKAVLDTTFPCVGKFYRPKLFSRIEEIERLASLEYLLQYLNVSLG